MTIEQILEFMGAFGLLGLVWLWANDKLHWRKK